MLAYNKAKKVSAVTKSASPMPCFRAKKSNKGNTAHPPGYILNNVAIQSPDLDEKGKDKASPSLGPHLVKNFSTTVSRNIDVSIPQADAGTNPQKLFLSNTDRPSPEETDTITIAQRDATPGISQSDSIVPTVIYSATIANTGVAEASDFGDTYIAPEVSGINVTPDAAAHAFNLSATINNNITWGVHSIGHTDISDENAAAINSTNYPNVVADLTPNMSDLGGRPPRAKFWAQDLTEKHEKFHANEGATTYGTAASTAAINWLKTQAAGTAADATLLANKLPGKMVDDLKTNYVPGAETRAYGDGATSYQTRAAAVKTKGTAGSYPAPPAPAPPAPPAPVPAPAPAPPAPAPAAPAPVPRR